MLTVDIYVQQVDQEVLAKLEYVMNHQMLILIHLLLSHFRMVILLQLITDLKLVQMVLRTDIIQQELMLQIYQQEQLII